MNNPLELINKQEMEVIVMKKIDKLICNTRNSVKFELIEVKELLFDLFEPMSSNI